MTSNDAMIILPDFQKISFGILVSCIQLLNNFFLERSFFKEGKKYLSRVVTRINFSREKVKLSISSQDMLR